MYSAKNITMRRVKISKHKIYDMLHQSSVFILASWAVGGAVGCGYLFFRFFAVGKPKMEQQYGIMRQEQLALEQAEREAVLLEEQRKAETL